LKSLNGLWKIDGKVLVQLQGAIFIDHHKATQNLKSINCHLRVIRGDWYIYGATSPIVLVSVLPKHDVRIIIEGVSFHHTARHVDYFAIEGIILRKDQHRYGPEEVKAAIIDVYNGVRP